MKFGKVKLGELNEIEMFGLLQDIIRDCVEYAGDSYEDFGRNILKDLKSKNLVDYGEVGK